MTQELPRTDALQPLSETQIKQIREYVDKIEKTTISRWNIPEGTERTWELRITPELVILYADGIEDFNQWYDAWPVGPGESPFGTAIAPPMLIASRVWWFFNEALGSIGGGPKGVAVSWETEIVAPCHIGTLVRFNARMARKYVKRGRQYVRVEATVENAETGELLCRHAQESIAKYEKVDEEGE